MIVWSLTLVPLLKYVSMPAGRHITYLTDNLLLVRSSLLSNLVREKAKEAHLPFSKASTHLKSPTKTMNDASRATQHVIPRLRPQSALVSYAQSSGRCSVGFVFFSFCKPFSTHHYFQTLFGTALTFGDGMLTPAVSVTSAVGGIALGVPSLNSNISSISIGFLVVLFLAQRFGTAKLSFIFSPGESLEPVKRKS